MKSISRTDLYKLIWSKPIRDVANELGYSDKGLAKICDRLDVPRPPQGYWNKIQAGQKPEVIALPNEEGKREIVFSVRERKETKQTSPPIKIHVPDKLTDPHPLIIEAKGFLRMPPNKRNWELKQKILNIKTSTEALPRALRVFDAIIKELEKRGAPVLIKEGNTLTRIGNEDVKFFIEERNQLEIIEDEERRKSEFLYRPERRFHPTGRLSLVIDEYCDHVRRLFQDGRKQTVEKAAGDFVVGIFEMAKALKERTEYWEAFRKKSEESKKLREIEESREKLLFSEMQRAESIFRVQTYLTALQEKRVRGLGEGDIWVNWVLGYLEKLKNGQLVDRLLLEKTCVEG